MVEMQVRKLQWKCREGRFWLQGDLAFFNSARKHLAIAQYILYGNMGCQVSEEGMKNYRMRAIITCGLYTFYPLFEIHLCTVTFGLMYVNIQERFRPGPK